MCPPLPAELYLHVCTVYVWSVCTDEVESEVKQVSMFLNCLHRKSVGFFGIREAECSKMQNSLSDLCKRWQLYQGLCLNGEHL